MRKHEIFKIACGKRSAAACEIEEASEEHALMVMWLHVETGELQKSMRTRAWPVSLSA